MPGQLAGDVVESELRILQLRVHLGRVRVLDVIFLDRVGEPKFAQLCGIFLERAGPAGLDLHAAQAFLDLLHDVVHAEQVLVNLLELALGFLLLDLVLGDPRRFFEDQPALGGIRFEQRRHASLLDHAVGVDAHARVEEKIADILEA
jgi:hypothetical protein